MQVAIIPAGFWSLPKMTNKNELIAKIKELNTLTLEEKSQLIELLNHKKRYGLVWEDKPETAEEILTEKLPLFKEVESKAIINKENKNVPNHILIEGDNLHALTTLCYTHENKIDVIYIDPPYNTGNKDFKYNDSYVDKEDSYRHSKWLSFIHKRLRLSKKLLKETGVIFISLDDNEVAQLKLLCDDIFRQENFIGCLPTIMNLKGNQDEFAFAGTHEYTLVYSKNKLNCLFNEFDLDDEGSNDWEEDDFGFYKKGATMKSSGGNAPREKRPNLFYPLLLKEGVTKVETITDEEFKYIYDKSTKLFNDNFVEELKKKYETLGYIFLLPISNEAFVSWRWERKKVIAEPHNIIANVEDGNISLNKKQRPSLGDLPSKKPKTILYKPEYSSGNGTTQVKTILGEKKINNPKPIELIKDFLHVGGSKNAMILDFFAGSGTTLHATMELNEKDDGNRQCILVTNNENNICEEVTYIRNKKVIEGYTKPNGDTVEGLANNNLRYFKMEFVGREKTLKNKRELMQLCTDVLKIKENCYEEIKGTKQIRIFNNEDLYLFVIMDDSAIPASIQLINKLSETSKIKVYVFAEGQDPYTEDFMDVLHKVELCALPDAIYKAFQNVLPKKKKLTEEIA